MFASGNQVKDSKDYLGPHGLGDPNDRSLRRIEIEVLIPKKIREKAKAEKCSAEVSDFLGCCKENGLTMVVKCRKENQIMKDCLERWFKDPEFQRQCREEYLLERSEYRRTGIGKKKTDK